MALKFKKAGGGFLNGETAKIVGYGWDTKEWGEGEKAYSSLTLRLDIQQDGADEPVKQFLPAGFAYEGMTISDDELTVEGGDDPESAIVGEKSEAGRFLQTLVENGFPEDDIPDNCRNLEALLDWRVTFGKELNKERQMAAGKKKLGKAKAASASEEDIMKAGRRQDKNDKTKFYNHDQLVVTAVVGKDEGGKKGKAAAGKKTESAKSAKGSSKKKDADEEVDYTRADEVLLELLADAKGGVINKSSISSLVVRKALADDMETEERDSLRKLLSDTDYLKRKEGWTFDADDKKQPITLVVAKKGKK